jgi:nucleoside-diphosphate-sugar epimerase/predicted dehydrogenase
MQRRLKIGFLGAGYIADWHAKALRTVSGTGLAAICDRDAERAQVLAERYGISRVYTSLSELLAAGDLDAVHVLVPPDLHAQAAGEIIDAGADVLLEKPMALGVDDCTRLIEQARQKGVKIGISHNFLFAPIYERLKNDLSAGKLGRPDELIITWNKGLDQLQTGPFNLWMLKSAENIMLEVGPHSVAHMLDLVRSPQVDDVRVANPIDLPSGVRFFRRWRVVADRSTTHVALNFSFAPGFTEHSIHLRGSLASATVDFEANTYVLHRHTEFGLDYDRYCMTLAESKQRARQARQTFGRVVLSKIRPAGGNPYGESIAKALQAFYAGAASTLEPRLAPEFGRDVVQTCVDIGRQSQVGAVGSNLILRTESPPSATCVKPGASAPKSRPEIFVLGATGFIGQELVRQLMDRGHSVRVLVRSLGRVPADFNAGRVEVVVGNLENRDDLSRALEGVSYVYHLAKPLVKRWEDYAKHDVEATRGVAEACLCANVKRLIYTGTIDSYYAGVHAKTITEETPLDPQIGWRNYYCRSKTLSERVLMSFYREKGLPVVIFRPGIVIGRGGSPFHWGIGYWSWNAVCQIWGKGRHPLPFVLVEDVVQALTTALGTSGIDGESFNLVADSRLTALEYLEALENCTASEFQKLPTSPWKFYLLDIAKWIAKRLVRHPDRRRPSYRDWETRTQRAIYDCSKARRVLNWNPESDHAELVRRGIQLPAGELLA